jgi:hypothetical protein
MAESTSSPSEVKANQTSTLHYTRLEVRDNPKGSTAVKKFKDQVRNKTYLVNLKRKEHVHHGTTEGAGGPLETILKQISFKAFVFGTFRETSSSVGKLVETAMVYEVEHLERNMAATHVDTIRSVFAEAQ